MRVHRSWVFIGGLCVATASVAAGLAGAATTETKGVLPTPTHGHVKTLLKREAAVVTDLKAFQKLGKNASVAAVAARLKTDEDAQARAIAAVNSDLSGHVAAGPKSSGATATRVAKTMIAKGVPATIALTYTAGNDPNNLLGRQGGYSSKVSLQDSRLPTVHNFLSKSASSIDGGGSLECYPTGAAAQSRYEYLKHFKGSFFGDGYDYLSGSCVLRLSSALTPTQASQYQQTFEATSK